jgi:Trk K+ transport system NAD-binding subunit
MKLLVCGAGTITDELLKRIGANWQITLIDKKEAKLAPFSNRFPNVVRVLTEDASSPVVLQKSGLADQDGVLAMTNDDAVNLAVAGFARQADIKTVLAVVRDPEHLPDFQRVSRNCSTKPSTWPRGPTSRISRSSAKKQRPRSGKRWHTGRRALPSRWSTAAARSGNR